MKLHPLIFCLIATTAFSQTSQSFPDGPKTFAIVPIIEPSQIELRSSNYTPPPSQQKKFVKNVVGKSAEGIGSKLQDSVAQKLKRAGLTQVSSDGIQTNAKSPRKVDYGSIQQSPDVIVHLYFDGIGVISTDTAIGTTLIQADPINFVPFVFVSYCLVVPKNGNKCHIENTGVYGNRTAHTAPLEYKSAPDEIWQSFADIETRPNSVADSLINGALRLGGDIADIVINMK